jgi:hypothetical protein
VVRLKSSGLDGRGQVVIRNGIFVPATLFGSGTWVDVHSAGYPVRVKRGRRE